MTKLQLAELARARVRAGDFDGAERALRGRTLGLDKMLENTPSHDLMYSQNPASRVKSRGAVSAESALLAGAGELVRGNFHAARELAGRSLKADPTLAAARLLRAAAVLYGSPGGQRTDGKLRRCLSDLNRALDAWPHDVRALRLRAEVHNDLENTVAAADDLRRALELNPSDEWAKVELADMLCDEGRFAEARPLLNFNPAHRRSPWYWAIRGRALALSGSASAGLRCLSRAWLMQRPSSRSAPIAAWRGEIRRRQARYGAAMSDFDQAITLDPDFVYAYEWRSRLCLMLGREREALADARFVVARHPRHQYGPALRGEAHFKLGHSRQAARDFERVHPLSPVATWNPRATEGRRPPPREPALREDLDFAVRRRPGDAWALAFRGRCRLDMGETEQAAEDLSAACALDPHCGYARDFRGLSKLILGDYRAALEDLRDSRALWPRVWRGQALAGLGRHREALDEYEKVLHHPAPRFEPVKALRDESLRRLG